MDGHMAAITCMVRAILDCNGRLTPVQIYDTQPPQETVQTDNISPYHISPVITLEIVPGVQINNTTGVQLVIFLSIIVVISGGFSQTL